MSIFRLVTMAIVLVGVLAKQLRARERRRARLLVLAGAVRGEVSGHAICGARHGVRYVMRFGTRGQPGGTEGTQIDVELPAGYWIAVHGRPHGMLTDRAASRLALGDELDRRLHVEAAPEDVVRALLDDPTRRFLVAASEHGGLELDTFDRDGRSWLRVSVRARVDRIEPATALLDGVVRIAARVREAFHACDRVVTVAHGAPYRPTTDDVELREAWGERVWQVVDLEITRDRRARRAMLRAWFAFAGLVAVLTYVLGH
ncbi:MAG TPA: hypothetical protein VFQ53_02185 [Kofleriaceae bacterium]|nr:hypothetical protein [Kofleriaceae bacterium]